VNGLAYDAFEDEGRADAVYWRWRIAAVITKNPLKLWTSASGADWRGNRRQEFAAGAADIITFSPAADTPAGKKQVKCYPFKTGYRRKHVCHPLSAI
jgi:hypothetical protein